MRLLGHEYHGGPPEGAELLEVPAPATHRAKRDPGPKYGQKGFNTSPAAHFAHRGIIVVKGMYPPSLRDDPASPCDTYEKHRKRRPFDEGDLEGTFGMRPGVMVKSRKQVRLNPRSAKWSPAVWRAVRQVLIDLRLLHAQHHFFNGHTILCTFPGSKNQRGHTDFRVGGYLFNRSVPKDGVFLYPISVLLATSPEGRSLGLKGGEKISIKQWDAFVFRGDLWHHGTGYTKYNEAQHVYVGCAHGGKGKDGKYKKREPGNAVIIHI